MISLAHEAEIYTECDANSCMCGRLPNRIRKDMYTI